VAADLDLVRQIVAGDHGLAVVALTRPDGSIQTSVVNAGVLDDPTGTGKVVGFVAQGRARKLAHIRRTKRASLTFRNGWQWVAVEGAAQIVGPDDPVAGVDPASVPELLRIIFRSAGGTHEDWDEFDRVMAAERRAAVLVQPQRITSNPSQ
jgi:PPOX class probable F420-dependent enzyme